MSTTTTDDLIRDYLQRLRAAAVVLPPDRREELIAEITEHIDGARLAGQAGTAAEAHTLLDRLGEPSEIVAAATAEAGAAGGHGGWNQSDGAEPPWQGGRSSAPYGSGPSPYPPPPRKAGIGLEIAAVILLTVGSVIPVIGWLVGVVLLWSSRRWRIGEKILGTLIVPFGPGILLPLSTLAIGPTSTCYGSSDGFSTCTTSGPPEWAMIAGAGFITVAPFIVGFWLLAVARRRADAEASDGQTGGQRHGGPSGPADAAQVAAQPLLASTTANPTDDSTYHARSAWGGLELGAVVTVALGGLVLPVFGTLVGLALVWFSSRWEHQTKVAATLLAAIPIALWVAIGPVLAVRGEGGSFGLSQALLSGGHAPFIAMAVATALLNLCPLGAAAVLAHRLNGDIASTQPDRPRAGES